MEWSSETHCFIHDEIMTVLSKKLTGLHKAVPNIAAFVQPGFPVLPFFSLSLFQPLQTKPASLRAERSIW